MNRRTFVKTLLLSSGALIFGAHGPLSASEKANAIKISMIYNNTGDSPAFLCEWGVAVWVEDQDDAVLFDTGQTPSKFWDNMQKLKMDIRKLSKIIISHNHRDHAGGLGLILEKTAYAPKVYVPRDELKNFQNRHPRATITGVGDPIQINPFSWTTGSLKGFIHEQGMIVEQEKAMLLITGCAHPGVVEMVQRAKTIHPDKKLSLVMGGFHMYNYSDEVVIRKSDKLRALGVRKIAPSHCTGSRPIRVFKERWQENFVDFGAGDGMTV